MKTIRCILFAITFLSGVCATPLHAEERSGNLYWAPPNITVGGQQIDWLISLIFILTLVVFVITQIVYVYYLIKYRRRPGHKAHYSHGNNFLEIVWTTIPTVIFLALGIYSNRVWHDLTRTTPPPNSLNVDIVSYQFGWDFRYPGADGILGAMDVKNITLENKFGTDASDHNGDDDFTSSEFVIPVNHPVHVFLRSRDVIHSFYVPEFRLYQDAVPGRTISWIWFQATQTGDFELACSQLCGVGHFNMKARIRILPPDEYQAWYEGKVKAAAQAQAGEQNPSSIAQQ